MKTVTYSLRGRREGFTLIEVMVSVAIIGIVVMGTMQYSVQSARIISTQADARAAYFRARQRMELIMAAPPTASFWSSLSLNGSYYLYNYNETTGSFTATTSETSGTETIDVNTTTGQIWSKVTRLETSKPSSEVQRANFVEIEVFVSYGDGPRENVRLKSSRAVYQ